MPEPDGYAETWCTRFGPLSPPLSTRRRFLRYRSGEFLCTCDEATEATDPDVGIFNMDFGRPELIVGAGLEDNEESSSDRFDC
jgi:hypothetical protein